MPHFSSMSNHQLLYFLPAKVHSRDSKPKPQHILKFRYRVKKLVKTELALSSIYTSLPAVKTAHSLHKIFKHGQN